MNFNEINFNSYDRNWKITLQFSLDLSLTYIFIGKRKKIDYHLLEGDCFLHGSYV